MSRAGADEGLRARCALLLCTHNGADHLGPFLDSVTAQSRPLDEAHVFDWASADRTTPIVEGWMEHARNDGIRSFLHRMDTAPGPARSFLRALAGVAADSDADLVFIADQDDVWHVDKVRMFADEYLARPFDLAHSDVQVLYEADGRVVDSFYGQGGPFRRPDPVPEHSVLVTNTAIGMTMCVRRAWLAGLTPVLDLDWVMHDWALSILCWMQAGRRRYINAPLVTYRQHGANTLGAHDTRSWTDKLLGARRHVSRVRRQIEAAATAVGTLHPDGARHRTLVALNRRGTQATVAATCDSLTPRYRAMLAASFLLL